MWPEAGAAGNRHCLRNYALPTALFNGQNPLGMSNTGAMNYEATARSETRKLARVGPGRALPRLGNMAVICDMALKAAKTWAPST
jgi:hypothetical protein